MEMMGTSCMAVFLTKQLGFKHLVVFINTCDASDEEMEIREFLEELWFSECCQRVCPPSVLLRTLSLSWGWRPSTS